MSHRPSRRTRTTVPLALAAGALVLSGAGGAVAGSMVTGAQIKNGTVTGIDVRNGTVTGADVKNQSLSAAELTPAAVKNLRGKPGPRGWARVDADGDVVVQSGGVTISRPQGQPVGRYCVAVTGVDMTKTVVVASPYFPSNGTNTGDNGGQSIVEASRNDKCPQGGVEVVAMIRTFTVTANDVVSTNLTLTDQPFTVVVP